MPGFPLGGEMKDRHGSVAVSPMGTFTCSLGSAAAQSWMLGRALRREYRHSL